MTSMINRLALVCIFLFAPLTRSDVLSSQVASWLSPRAALIRDAIYFEGGTLKTSEKIDGERWNPSPKPYLDASIFRIRLNESFDIHDNRPALFEALNEAQADNPLINGYMFADTDEFYAWGGYARSTQTTDWRVVFDPLFDPPEDKADNVNYFRKPRYNYEPEDFAFKITHGAGVNVPSESLSFYFGGLRKEDNTLVGLRDYPPVLEPSNLLVKVNTTNQAFSLWTPIDLPPDIRTRAEAGLVWIPAGSMGMLVAFGGTINQSSIYNTTYTKANPEDDTNDFTQEILLFDPSAPRWYKQSIQVDAGFPPRLAAFCAVAATHGVGDNKHHDIYVIGGFTDSTTFPNPDIWVLSIPSFKWTKLPIDGRAGLERYSHSCFLPYPSPNQIITVGGVYPVEANFREARAVDVFDMDTLKWTGAYNPTQWTPYVPSKAINDTNPAEPIDGLDPGLLSVLRTTYDPEGDKTTKAKFWPFPDASRSSPSPTPTPDPDPQPGYVVPVAATLGTVGGLAIIALIAFCCIRRPRQQQRDSHRQSTVTTGTAGHGWIDKWRRTAATSIAPKDVASDTITETDGAISPQPQAAMSETTYRNSLTQPSELETGGGYYHNSRPPIYEIDSSTLHEVHGRSSPGHFHEELDPRRFPMYPPSVVSGGHNSHSVAGDDSSFSHPPSSPAGLTATSPTASATASRSSPLAMAPIASITEAAAFSLSGQPSSDDGDKLQQQATPQKHLAHESSQRAVSPILSDSGVGGAGIARRPGHRRHNSSMSSGLSPLPSPEMRNGFDEEDEDGVLGRDGGRGNTI